MDTLGESFYKVGAHRINQFTATKDEIQAMYKGSGFKVVTWRQFDIPYDPVMAENFSDLAGAYVMLAKKES